MIKQHTNLHIRVDTVTVRALDTLVNLYGLDKSKIIRQLIFKEVETIYSQIKTNESEEK